MHKIEISQPVEGETVEIKTNWKTYLAKIQKSFSGGYEFRVLNSAHMIQITVVTGWCFAGNSGLKLRETA